MPYTTHVFHTIKHLLLGLLLLAIPCSSLASAPPPADYQWSALVEELVSPETQDHPRAFLWIPPQCRRVRAVVIGQHNMQEEPILEHPAFRRELAALCFAEVWVTPAMGSIHFRFDRGAGEMLDRLMAALAEQSGYSELRRAPLLPIGHSAMASFGWDMAAWDARRVLAVISTSGMWPYYKDAGDTINSSPDWKERSVDGVPGLVLKGEYEVQGNMRTGWYAKLKGDMLERHPDTVLTHVVEPGGGHFDASDQRVALMALFVRKAAQYRLGRQARADGAVSLRPIDPRRTGWLFDGWQLDTAPAAPAAPVQRYRGPRQDAYWAFDGEMTAAIEQFQGRHRGQRTVLLGYRQSQGMVAPRPDHAMVHLQFEPLDDNLSFKLSGAFWDQVPGDGKTDPATGQQGTGGWGAMLAADRPGVRAGDPLPHPATDPDSGAAMRIARICGPVVQLAPDTFALRFYRMGMNNSKRSNDIWFALSWPGDGLYKPMVQQAELKFPLTNTEGGAQSITFAPIMDQQAAPAMPSLRLQASSSAGLPVHYYVREGPAVVGEDGVLSFTALPVRARYPIKVTVVAWQWGRRSEPKLQSAAPVERQFLITAPSP